MNVSESVEIEDSSLGLIILGVTIGIALFTNHTIAGLGLLLLALQLFKNELKSFVNYVVGKTG